MKLLYILVILGLGLYFWMIQKPSPSGGGCPDASLCFDCNSFRSFGSSAFSTTEKGIILPIKQAFEVCKRDTNCVGILSSGKEGMLLTKIPSNSGIRNSSIYFEKV